MAENKIIEENAIKVVIAYEKWKNRKPQDVRHQKTLGYDVSSSGRIIEVKGIAKTLAAEGSWRWVTQKTAKLLMREKTLYIYIVDNLSKGINNANLTILNRTEALPLLNLNASISYSLQKIHKKPEPVNLNEIIRKST
jgi:hypothetical protein